jgi:hemerythrin superfamily protein
VLAMLQRDHRKVEQLFQQFEKAKEPRQKQRLFQSIRNELELHAQVEEELFYPRAEDQGDKDLKDQVEEAHGEHDKVKQMLREAEGLDPDSGEFDATVAALRGAVEHHVEEEENEMFDKVRERMTAADLKEMGRELEQLRSTIRPGNGGGGSDKGLVGRLMGR